MEYQYPVTRIHRRNWYYYNKSMKPKGWNVKNFKIVKNNRKRMGESTCINFL